mmetsp:Transcript_17206/g.39113  ORF Transcript_17206/g.39113 Transcript_17206/m.39113 type:complete len:255 (-) Transcript_17206:1218-1982(-)
MHMALIREICSSSLSSDLTAKTLLSKSPATCSGATVFSSRSTRSLSTRRVFGRQRRARVESERTSFPDSSITSTTFLVLRTSPVVLLGSDDSFGTCGTRAAFKASSHESRSASFAVQNTKTRSNVCTRKEWKRPRKSPSTVSTCITFDMGNFKRGLSAPYGMKHLRMPSLDNRSSSSTSLPSNCKAPTGLSWTILFRPSLALAKASSQAELPVKTKKAGGNTAFLFRCSLTFSFSLWAPTTIRSLAAEAASFAE